MRWRGKQVPNLVNPNEREAARWLLRSVRGGGREQPDGVAGTWGRSQKAWGFHCVWSSLNTPVSESPASVTRSGCKFCERRKASGTLSYPGQSIPLA